MPRLQAGAAFAGRPTATGTQCGITCTQIYNIICVICIDLCMVFFFNTISTWAVQKPGLRQGLLGGVVRKQFGKAVNAVNYIQRVLPGIVNFNFIRRVSKYFYL